jgi:hypothetical protein
MWKRFHAHHTAGDGPVEKLLEMTGIAKSF